MGRQQVYINFPIQLIRGLLTEKTYTLDRCLNYALYSEAASKIHKTRVVDDQNFEDAADKFLITVHNISRDRTLGEQAYKKYPHRSSPMVGISKDMFFDFYDNDKSEFELVILLGYLAFKSIIGDKPYIKTGSEFLLSRMDGHLKKVDPSKLSQEIKKWSSDYKLQKVKTGLVHSWGLVHYSRQIKGFYVSFKLSLSQLAEVAEEKREIGKILYQEQKRAENEARNAAISKLFNSEPWN